MRLSTRVLKNCSTSSLPYINTILFKYQRSASRFLCSNTVRIYVFSGNFGHALESGIKAEIMTIIPNATASTSLNTQPGGLAPFEGCRLPTANIRSMRPTLPLATPSQAWISTSKSSTQQPRRIPPPTPRTAPVQEMVDGGVENGVVA